MVYDRWSMTLNTYHVTLEPMEIFSQIVALAILDEINRNVLDELSFIVYEEGTLTDVTVLTAPAFHKNVYRVSGLTST